MPSPKIPPPQGVGMPDFARSIERAIRDATTTTVTDVSGGFTVTTTGGERVFLIYVSGASVTLPETSDGKLTFKLMAPGSLTLLGVIDGASSAVLSTQYEAVTLYPSGGEWMVLMAYQPQAEVVSALTTQAELTAEMLAALKALIFQVTQDDPAKLIAEFSN